MPSSLVGCAFDSLIELAAVLHAPVAILVMGSFVFDLVAAPLAGFSVSGLVLPLHGIV